MKRQSRREVFFSKVNKTNECWIWIGYKNNKGYGSFLYQGGTLAHRYSYMIHNREEIPSGMMICHSCDNPSCVNPKHLWVGSAQDNIDDCVKKKRNKIVTVRGEQNGLSKLNEQQVYEILKNENKLTQKQFALKFNCNVSNIHYVQSGKTWKHVLPDLIRKTKKSSKKLKVKVPKTLETWIEQYHAKKNTISQKDTK